MPIAKALSLSLAVAAGVFAAPNAEVLQAPSRCVERETVIIDTPTSRATSAIVMRSGGLTGSDTRAIPPWDVSRRHAHCR